MTMIRFALAFGAAIVASNVSAHQAPTGWSYPTNCCSNQDCREVRPAYIKEGAAGYEIVPTGEVIPMTDQRIKQSPDGEFHWCTIGGTDHGATICLFVPPRTN